MTMLARFEETSSAYVKNRIRDISLFLRDWSACPKHRKRIPLLEKRLTTTSCLRVVLNNLKSNGWKYGLFSCDASVLNRKVDGILIALRRTKEITSIFEQKLLKEYSPRFSTSSDAIYLTTPEIVLNGIDFGRFRVAYNWQTDSFWFEPMGKPVYSYESAWSFRKIGAYFHPLTRHLEASGQSLYSYLKANVDDFSLVKIFRLLIDTLCGKRVDFSNIIETFWGPRKCKNCSAIVKVSDVGRCIECTGATCSACEVIEVWLDDVKERYIYTLCESCALRLMEK